MRLCPICHVSIPYLTRIAGCNEVMPVYFFYILHEADLPFRHEIM
jgi:hypothetical protein